MKIIIYITALICSLLASPALATETGQISMTNMGLKVTSSPESTLYEGDTWMITARNNFSLNEAEIKNFVPSRISDNGRSDRYDTVRYQRIPSGFSDRNNAS